MKDNTSNKSDSWKAIFNGLAEAIKMIFSIILTVAGGKAVTSTDDEEQQADYRNGLILPA